MNIEKYLLEPGVQVIRPFWNCSRIIFTKNENDEQILQVFFVHLFFSTKTIRLVKILRICFFGGEGKEKKRKDLRSREFFKCEWNAMCVNVLLKRYVFIKRFLNDLLDSKWPLIKVSWKSLCRADGKGGRGLLSHPHQILTAHLTQLGADYARHFTICPPPWIFRPSVGSVM